MFGCSYEMIPNAPKHCETHENMSLGSNGWIECVRREKLQHNFVAWTFALIAPVHPVLHQVSWSCETIPNKPKHYATHQNMCLGFNGVDRVRSLRKITTRLRGTNFCNNGTSSPHFALNFLQLRNNPKCTQRLWNTQKHECWSHWGGSGAFVATNSDTTSWHEILY